MPHILRHNYYLINKQSFSGLKLLSLWLSVRAHLNFPGHILSQATVQLCGNYHLITATKTGSIAAPTQVPLRGINGSKRRLSISWHWTTMQAHTSARITEVHRQALQQLAELCLHHLSVQWQGGGTLLSGCFCQGKQRSLAASPISHTNRVLQTSALTMQHFSTLYMKRDLKQIENTILDWRQTYALSIPRLGQHSGSPHICKDTHRSQLSFLSPHHSLHRSLSFFAYNGCFKQLWLKGQFARGFLKGTAERLHLSDADMAAKHRVSEGAQLKMGWETVDLTATETR